MENPENITIKNKSDEIQFVRGIEGQIGLWLNQNGDKLKRQTHIHNFFLNKASYYSALLLNKKISSGWYLYGPYLRNYREELQDEDKTISAFQFTNIVVKAEESLISKKVQTLLSELFEHYEFDPHNQHKALYHFLEYIYKNKNEPFPEGKQFYLAKLNCIAAIYDNTEDFSKIEKAMINYQKEIYRTSFAEKIEISEKEQKVVTQYGDMLLDAFEKRMPPDIKDQLIREFSGTVNKIPALRTNIITGKSYDEKTEQQWKDRFSWQLKEEIIPTVENSLKHNSKVIYSA